MNSHALLHNSIFLTRNVNLKCFLLFCCHSHTPYKLNVVNGIVCYIVISHTLLYAICNHLWSIISHPSLISRQTRDIDHTQSIGQSDAKG